MYLKKQFLRHQIMLFISAAVISTGVWSCKSSSHSTQNAYKHEKPSENKRPKPDKRPLPEAAKLPVQKSLVSNAREWIGTPYLWGGEDKNGADCSGFVMTLFKDVAGISLPRNSRKQKEYCVSLDKEYLEVGDLVFFSSPKSGGDIAHVGMYIGDNKMIHASSSRGVIESDLSLNYYITHYKGAGRVPTIAQVLPIENKPDTKVNPDAELKERQIAQHTPAPTPKPASKPTPKPELRGIAQTNTKNDKASEDKAHKPDNASEGVIVLVPSTPVLASNVTLKTTDSANSDIRNKVDETPVAAGNIPSKEREKATVETGSKAVVQPTQSLNPEDMVAKAFAGRKN